MISSIDGVHGKLNKRFISADSRNSFLDLHLRDETPRYNHEANKSLFHIELDIATLASSLMTFSCAVNVRS